MDGDSRYDDNECEGGDFCIMIQELTDAEGQFHDTMQDGYFCPHELYRRGDNEGAMIQLHNQKYQDCFISR